MDTLRNIHIISLLSFQFCNILFWFQWKQHRRHNRHDILRGMLVLRRRAQHGAAAGRRARDRVGRQQAGLRASVRRAPLHARRRAAVARAATRPGRHHPLSATEAVVTAWSPAFAGWSCGFGPGWLAPSHEVEARDARCAYCRLVLGDCRGVWCGNEGAFAAVCYRLEEGPARWLSCFTGTL